MRVGSRLPAARQAANSAAFRAAAEVIALAVAMGSTILLARAVGPSAMGTFALAVLIGQVAVTIGDLGMAQALQASVARGIAPVRAAALRTFLLRLAAGSGVALVAAVLTIVLVPPTQVQLRSLILLALLGTPLNSMGETWAFLATGRVGIVSGLRIIGPACGLAVVATMVDGPEDTVAMAMLFLAPLAVSALAGTIFVAWLALRRPPAAGAPADVREMLSGARHFLVSGISVWFSFNADRLILGVLGLPVVLGLYDAANRMVAPFWSVAVVVSDANYRQLADADAAGDDRAARVTYRKVASLLLLPTIPVGLGATMFGRELLGLLFGPEFVAAYPYLVVLAWTMSLTYVVACYTVPLPPWRETAAVARLGLAGAASAILAGVPLVGLLGGLGAALSRALVQVSLGVAAYPARRAYVNGIVGQLLRALVIVVVLCGVAGWLVGALWGAWVPAIIAFCAVYTAGAVASLRRPAWEFASAPGSSPSDPGDR